MTKWDYIDLISKNGAPDGSCGGVLDLLDKTQKPNTMSVTLEEAKAFYECLLKEKEAQKDNISSSLHHLKNV